MGATEEVALSHIESCGVEYTLHRHEAVATVDAQVAALSEVSGTPIKNLFLKDKKHRYYVVSALPDTKVDLKALSARLGLGKGGISMAPEAALAEVLQVPLGSVTPLCICNASANSVILLLDQRIKSQNCVLVHPCVNTSSVALSPTALETVLRKFRPELYYVDFQADVKVDKDNPPDLKHVVEATDALKPVDENAKPATAPAEPSKKKSVAAAPAKPAKASANGKSTGSSTLSIAVLNTDDVINKVAVALTGKGIAEAGLDPYIMQRLRSDIETQLNSLRNTAYAAGYVAGKGEIVAYGQRQYT